MTDPIVDTITAKLYGDDPALDIAPSSNDKLIDTAMEVFVAEYSRHARPDYDDAEHDDCVRAALEAVIELVQGRDWDTAQDDRAWSSGRWDA